MTEPERDLLAQIRSHTAAVIPAYQDEKHIGDIARRTRQRVDHVVVVDDGSTDETAQRAREAGPPSDWIDTSRGRSFSIRTVNIFRKRLIDFCRRQHLLRDRAFSSVPA